MNLFYKATPKELLNLRNKVILETAIPILSELGFVKSPYSTSWFGRDDHGDFIYDLRRLRNSYLEKVEIFLLRGDKYVQIHLNIFQLIPTLDSIDKLKNLDGLQFYLPPNTKTNMRLRSDDIKGIPLFNSSFMAGHKLKSYWTKMCLFKNVETLRKTIAGDLNNLETFISRWHELHTPLKTDWEGRKVKEI